MGLRKNKIAMISPAFNAYSETFIQAQKTRLDGVIHYYYGGRLPTHLENFGPLLSLKKKIIYKVQKELGLSNFNPHELAFLKSLQQNKIDVVLAQYGPTAYSIVNICAHLKIPLITHFHGYDASTNSVIEKFDYYKDVFDYSTKIIAVSKKMKEMLVEIGCDKDKIIHNPYGPNPYFETITPKFSKKQFLAAGRFTDKKAPYYTILAFKDVLDMHPEAKLLMAGNGELENTCLNLIRYYGLEESVTLLGVVKPNELGNLMQESMAFIQHSVTAKNGDMEGTPVAILEANIASLPVISTFHAGIPDVIIDGQTGFLVNEHDVSSMTERMNKILNNKGLAKKMGKKGRENILNNFSMNHHINNLNKIIAESI